MERIAVITDVHGNLPALQAALAAMEEEACDLIYHLGDAVGIGPYPAECVALLLSRGNTRFVMGNHDEIAALGLPDPPPAWMDDGEIRHHHWVEAQLSARRRESMATWSPILYHETGGVRLAFCHYARNPTGSGFAPIIHDAEPEDLDRLFAEISADIIFYGHHHPASDLQGRARFVNPGSLGCHLTVARFALVTLQDGSYVIEQHSVPYDPHDLLAAFQDRNVPEREFILQTFYGANS